MPHDRCILMLLFFSDNFVPIIIELSMNLSSQGQGLHLITRQIRKLKFIECFLGISHCKMCFTFVIWNSLYPLFLCVLSFHHFHSALPDRPDACGQITIDSSMEVADLQEFWDNDGGISMDNFYLGCSLLPGYWDSSLFNIFSLPL